MLSVCRKPDFGSPCQGSAVTVGDLRVVKKVFMKVFSFRNGKAVSPPRQREVKERLSARPWQRMPPPGVLQAAERQAVASAARNTSA